MKNIALEALFIVCSISTLVWGSEFFTNMFLFGTVWKAIHEGIKYDSNDIDYNVYIMNVVYAAVLAGFGYFLIASLVYFIAIERMHNDTKRKTDQGQS